MLVLFTGRIDHEVVRKCSSSHYEDWLRIYLQNKTGGFSIQPVSTSPSVRGDGSKQTNEKLADMFVCVSAVWNKYICTNLEIKQLLKSCFSGFHYPRVSTAASLRGNKALPVSE